MQRTGEIQAKPAVKSQSASAAPGIATAPRSVVQVPMSDKEEDEESGHDDDEDDVDDINYAALPKDVVRVNRRKRRRTKSLGMMMTKKSWTT